MMRHTTRRYAAIAGVLLGCLLAPRMLLAASAGVAAGAAGAPGATTDAPATEAAPSLVTATPAPEADPALVADTNLPASEGDSLPAGSLGEGVVEAAVKALPPPRPGSKKIDRAFVDQVFAEICRQGIREPQIVMRQALLETGWMRAPFLMKRNNLFGFRYRTYLTFDSWQDSVRYYRDWQKRRYKASDPSYYAFLTRIRYGAPTYLQHLHKMKWNKPCPPSPRQPLPPAMAESPAPETLAQPTLPSQVEAIVPPLVTPEPVAAQAAPVLPLAPAAAPAR